MSNEERMTIDERRKYLRQMQKRYAPACAAERSDLLSEMAIVTSLHRKSLIRLMASDLVRQPRRTQRGRTYKAEVDDALRVIAESYDYPCAERLQPNLMSMAQQLAQHGELRLSDTLRQQLDAISVSTVGRILQRIRQDEPHLPRKRPERANQVTREVPMRRIAWDEDEPGHFEVDLVHHCGPRADGDFMHSLQMIDVATGWSERVALLGRSYLVMEAGFERCRTRLPFAVREIHSDNGSEFLNHHLLRFWKEVVRNVDLSRSRPYQKNDNRFVEQKNYSLVRAYLGNERLDSVPQVMAANHLYDQMWLYYNLFQPVMRMTEKIIHVAEDGSHRVERHFDQARTPFDRLCATSAIAPARRVELERVRNRTNPRRLRLEINDRLEHIFTLPAANAGASQDVYDLLLVLKSAPFSLP